MPFSVLVLAMCLLTDQRVTIGPIEAIDVGGLISTSDVIVVGVMGGTLGRDLTRPKVVNIFVEQYIRPATGPTDIVVAMNLTDSEILKGGYQPLTPGSRRLIFLKRSNDQLRPTNDLFLGVNIAPGAVLEGETVEARVASGIASLLWWPQAKRFDQQRAIFELSQMPSAAARSELRHAMTHPTRLLQLDAATAALCMGELSALPMAVEVILFPTAADQNRVQYFRDAVRYCVRAPEAIPDLVRLLASPDWETRRAAATALRFMRTQTAVPALAGALLDSSDDVLYEVVVGLAGINGEQSLSVDRSAFDRRRAELLEYWRTWARDRGYIR